MEIIEGERSGSKFYVFEGHIFLRNKCNDEKLFVKCIDRKCPAGGHVRGQDFEMRRHHNHAPPQLRIKKLKLRQELKLKASQGVYRTSMRSAFDEACSSHDDAAAHVSFPSVKSTMYRAKKKSYPPQPTTLREYAEILGSNDWKNVGMTIGEQPQPFFNAYIGNIEENWEAVVFSSPSLTVNMQTTEELHIDATFKVVPRNFGYQLMTVHLKFMDHMLPAIYVLMSRKTEECYKGVINYITSQLVPQSVISVKKVMTDFEAALMNAAAAGWSNATVSGCFFHYAWAVYRKHQQLLMTNLTESNVVAKKALKCLMSLALLPHDKIREGLDVVRLLVLQNNLQRQFQRLCSYIAEYWIGTVGTDKMSVYNNFHRTNNSVEGFYSSLLSKMGAHPGIWQFTDILRKVEQSTRKDCERLGLGRDVAAPRRRRQNIQDKNIKKAWTFLEERRYSVQDFLNKCSHAVDGLESRLRGISLREAPEVDPEGNSDVSSDEEQEIQNILQNENEERMEEVAEEVAANVPIIIEQAGQNQGDRAQAYYGRYRTVPTVHNPNITFPDEFILKQREELSEALSFGPPEETSYEAVEGQVVCTICLLNAATRMAVPCGHYIVCRECLPGFVRQTPTNMFLDLQGRVEETPFMVPITCPTCRAIVGQAIPTY